MILTELEFDTNVEVGDGLFFQKDLSWETSQGEDIEFSTPLQPISMREYSEFGGVDDRDFEFSEVYVELDGGDLSRYRSDKSSTQLDKLEEQASASPEDKPTVVFIEFDESIALNETIMRDLLDIQREHSEFLTMPIQPTLFEAMSPFVRDDVAEELDDSPWEPYYSGMENFVEETEADDRLAIGTLPPLKFRERGREAMRYYETAGVKCFAIDFRGYKPTGDDIYEEIDKWVVDVGTRNVAERRILYALNYRQYSVRQSRTIHPSEAVLLALSGFDVLGGTYHYPGFGGGAGPPDNIKIFSIDTIGFEEVSLQNLVQEWPITSTIRPLRLARSYERAKKLRRIVNNEQLARAMRILRTAIRNGDANEFIGNKEGVTEDETILTSNIANSYRDAAGPNIVP